MSDSTFKKAEAPFAAPDVQWVKCSDSLPEGAIICGYIEKEPVYAGRVYFQNELLIGSVDWKKQLCIFCRDGAVHESSDFELMTVPVGEPLDWKTIPPESNVSKRQLLKAGRLKTNQVLYVARIVLDGKSFIGWADLEKKLAYVAKEGSEQICDEFEILIHKYLEFLCICPPCPPQCSNPTFTE